MMTRDIPARPDGSTSARTCGSEGAARTEVAVRVALEADPEVLLQMPRLKETLLVIDSEMHTTASSDIDKSLVMHERILQMQGAKVNKMRQTVDRSAQSVGQMMDTSPLLS
jgi:hypothetical protein